MSRQWLGPQLIQSPRLWPADPRNHRRVTWMELFFDLIFVAAVAEVGTPLRAEYTPAGLFRYTFLFILIWWAWTGHMLYSTRFNTDDLVQRLLILRQSFIAAVMAANARDGLDSRSSAGFGAAYGCMRLILVAQYLRARRVPETRALTTRDAIGFGLAAYRGKARPQTIIRSPMRRALMAAALDGKVYVIGGVNEQQQVTRQVSVYDPQTNQWSKGPELPEGTQLGFARPQREQVGESGELDASRRPSPGIAWRHHPADWRRGEGQEFRLDRSHQRAAVSASQQSDPSLRIALFAIHCRVY